MPEIDFPRGGTKPKPDKDGIQTATVKKRKADKSESEPAGKKTYEKIEKEELEGLFRRPITIDLLTPGVRCLGSIHKIQHDLLVLKAINNISVIVPIKSVSRMYLETFKQTKHGLDDLYTVGQLLAFKVDTVNSKKRGFKQISATTCPSEVNDCINVSTLFNGIVINAVVTSIEEKGAIFDIGVDSKVKGFAPTEALPSLKDMKIGQVMLMRVIRETNDLKRYIKLSAYPEMDTFDDQKMTTNNFMPGTVLNADPLNIVSNGVIVSLKNKMKAFIHKDFLPPRIRIDMEKLVRSFRVVVMVCNQNSPLLALSAHPDIVAISKVERRRITDDYEYGKIVDGIVYAVEKKGVSFVFQESSDKVSLITARLPPNEMENPDEVSSKYIPGSVHKLRVKKYSPLDRVIHVTDKKELLKAGNVLEEYEPGQLLTVKVDAIVDAGLKVSFGLNKRGMIFALQTLDIPTNSWKKAFKVNQKIKCRLLYKNEKGQYILTAKPTLVESTDEIINEFSNEYVGKTATGVCIGTNVNGAIIGFYNRVAGFLPKNLADLIPELKIGTNVTVKILKVDEVNNRMSLTMVLSASLAKEVKKNKKEKVKPGKPKKLVKNLDIYTAKLLNKWPFGGTSSDTTLLVELPGENIGRLHISELGKAKSNGIQQFLKKNKGKSITVRVIDVTKVSKVPMKMRSKLRDIGVNKFYEVSIDSSKLKEKKMKKKLLQYQLRFKPGNNVSAYLVDTKPTAKRQKLEINPKFSVFFAKKGPEEGQYEGKGQRIIATIVRINGRKLYVKRKGEIDPEEGYEFTSDEEIECEDSDNDAIEESGDELVESSDGEAIDDSEDEEMEDDDEQIDEDEEEDEYIEDEEMETVGADGKTGQKDKEVDKALGLLFGGSLWDAEAILPEKMKQVKKDVKIAEIAERKAKRERKKSENEREIEELSDVEQSEETKILHTEKILAGMEKSRELFSDSDYNRLVMCNPNSSEPWISYMAYQAQTGNLEDARKVAENALDTIDSKEEEERLNVFIAYMNLEVSAGDEESLKKVFVRACAAHNPYEVHKRLAAIFVNAKKYEELDKLYNVMIKKFGQIKYDVYVLYGTYLYHNGRKAEGRELMKKALSSLPKKHHLEILSRFAHLEYVNDDVERGKTMFEKAIAAAPKRGDLWNIYIDKAIKFQSPEDVREVFERATSASLGKNTIKNLYQKWKDFEKIHGDEESLQEVNDKAVKYLKKDVDED